jgi:hypothetical protein
MPAINPRTGKPYSTGAPGTPGGISRPPPKPKKKKPRGKYIPRDTVVVEGVTYPGGYVGETPGEVYTRLGKARGGITEAPKEITKEVIQERQKPAKPLTRAELFSPIARKRFQIMERPSAQELQFVAGGRRISYSPRGIITAPISATIRGEFAEQPRGVRDDIQVSGDGRIPDRPAVQPLVSQVTDTKIITPYREKELSEGC